VRLSLQLVASARRCDVLEHVGKGPRARDAIIEKLVQVPQSPVEGFRCHLVTACHERQRFGRCEHVEIGPDLGECLLEILAYAGRRQRRPLQLVGLTRV
jgi:hypothetical protein